MVICAAVKQCKVRWRELIRALWTCCTWVGRGRYLRFWVACERTHDCQMRYRISELVRTSQTGWGVVLENGRDDRDCLVGPVDLLASVCRRWLHCHLWIEFEAKIDEFFGFVEW